MALKNAVAADQTGSFSVLSAFFRAEIDRGEIDIPMLPEVAAQVIAAAGDPDTSARDMAQIILADPALAAHVMRVVTSAAYRPMQPIGSLHHAISWLGMGEVCELAFTAAVQSKVLNVPRQRVRAERLWSTAVGTAAWGRAIAEVCGRGGEVSYLAGLMHEIGIPVCLQALTDLARASDLPLADQVLDELVAEFKVDVGGRVARLWKLPEPIVAVVDRWAAWASAESYIDQCAVTYLAHQFAEHTLAHSEPLAVSIADDPGVAHRGLTPMELTGLVGQAAHIRGIVDSFRL